MLMLLLFDDDCYNNVTKQRVCKRVVATMGVITMFLFGAHMRAKKKQKTQQGKNAFTQEGASCTWKNQQNRPLVATDSIPSSWVAAQHATSL